MKKIYLTAALATITLFSGTSCSDFLDEEMKSIPGPNNTYTSSYGFEVAATGLYTWARDEYNTWGGSAFSHGQACPYEALQVATDIVFCGAQQDGSLVPFEKLSYTPSTRFVTSFWEWGYGLIASCNEMLEYSDINTNWDNKTDKVFYQATARFFRAYAYRTLVYLYGDVPYVSKIEKEFRDDFTRTPKAEVLSYMIDDLTFAAQNLPDNPDKLLSGKLTSWAAKHYLAEVYLMVGEYEKAITECNDIINSGKYSLMEERFGAKKDKPGDVYSDMFLEFNQNRESGNKEAIWVMQLEYKTTGGGDWTADWTRRAWSPKYWSKKGFVLADTLGGRGLAQIQPLTWWIEGKNFYDKTDIRNSEYNIKRHWYYNDTNDENYGKEAEITDETRKLSQIYPVITKFFYGKEDDLQYGGNNKDRMKIRLSETYLFKAEALIQLKRMKEAAEVINIVRHRAKASEINENQVNMDFLLDERIRELVGEETRRFTLQRSGKYIDRVKQYNPYSKDFSYSNLLWPIPQSVIDANTGSEFPQNP